MSQKQFLNKKTKRNKIKKEEEKNENENVKDEKMKEIKDNIIIGIIKVEKNDLKQKIINSYENAKKENIDFSLKGKENENEIKDCEIYINDKKIDFSYYYNFENEGLYKIKYIL